MGSFDFGRSQIHRENVAPCPVLTFGICYVVVLDHVFLELTLVKMPRLLLITRRRHNSGYHGGSVGPSQMPVTRLCGAVLFYLKFFR